MEHIAIAPYDAVAGYLAKYSTDIALTPQLNPNLIAIQRRKASEVRGQLRVSLS